MKTVAVFVFLLGLAVAVALPASAADLCFPDVYRARIVEYWPTGTTVSGFYHDRIARKERLDSGRFRYYFVYDSHVVYEYDEDRCGCVKFSLPQSTIPPYCVAFSSEGPLELTGRETAGVDTLEVWHQTTAFGLAIVHMVKTSEFTWPVFVHVIPGTGDFHGVQENRLVVFLDVKPEKHRLDPSVFELPRECRKP